ncbi:PRA1 family protein G2 [Tanacetum coccineum]
MQPSPRTTVTTYTTIPISGTDVIFRSFQNLSTFVSHHRPWPEFISGDFNRPDSVTDAVTRLKTNSKYFSVNYLIITAVISSLSLIGDPATLVMYATVVTSWLVLFVFREDPMNVCGYGVDDNVVILGLVLVSGFVLWIFGFVGSLVFGVLVAVFATFLHCVFRSCDGVYLDETDAVSQGLMSV